MTADGQMFKILPRHFVILPQLFSSASRDISALIFDFFLRGSLRIERGRESLILTALMDAWEKDGDGELRATP